jgi:hypothetical protein
VTRSFESFDELRAAGPTDLGSTDWVKLESKWVGDFRVATGDPSADSNDAAPALLLLALTNRFLPALMQVPCAASGINYGADLVRFPTPARPGDRLRATGFLLEVSGVPGGVQTRTQVRVEVEGADEPCCVVESLSRWLE